MCCSCRARSIRSCSWAESSNPRGGTSRNSSRRGRLCTSAAQPPCRPRSVSPTIWWATSSRAPSGTGSRPTTTGRRGRGTARRTAPAPRPRRRSTTRWLNCSSGCPFAEPQRGRSADDEERAMRRRRGYVVLAMVGIGFGALAGAYYGAVRHLPLATPVRPARAVPAAIDAAYHCRDDVPLAPQLEPVQIDDGLRFVRGRFVCQRPGAPRPHEVRFTFYRALGVDGPAPAFVVTPILGGPNEVARLVARDLARHGYHALIVDRRKPRDGTRFEAWERALADMVADRRRAIDWLQSLPEVDPARIGAYGVSLGGITTALLAALEPRLQVAVIVMAGGDLPQVIARSEEGECRLLRRAHGLGDTPSAAEIEAFETAARRVIRTDPLRFAPFVDPRKVVMFLTRRDHSVDSASQLRLWRAFGRPEAWSLPTGHYSAIIYLPLITDRARAFIARRFAESGPGPHRDAAIRLSSGTNRTATGSN
ncbi:MAG: hypothetical protein D6776_03590 [Planctomycetota bacterium]|nr:MAG: hypothetical protein D6776_03590 [Planctomycetota bacterium]